MIVAKRLVFISLILIALLLIGSLFLPSKVHVERSATIHALPDKVFQQLNALKNWEAWSPWHKLDPKMTLSYSGPPSGLGAKYSWSSAARNVGTGALTIIRSVPDETLETAIHFTDGDGVGRFQLNPANRGTVLTWSMEMNMGRNPIARYFGLLMDRVVGPDFERGLSNLTTICETK